MSSFQISSMGNNVWKIRDEASGAFTTMTVKASYGVILRTVNGCKSIREVRKNLKKLNVS